MDSTYNLNGGFKPTLKRFADLAGPDYFPTPEWATHALTANETFEGNIWEPACGDGAMSRVLEQTGCEVDFLKADRIVDNIVTNPPYNSAEAFVKAGLLQSRRKVALLLRLAFVEGANRQRTIFSKTPPTRIWVFSERITFYPAGAVQKGSGTTAYAWFVWDKQDMGRCETKWLPLGYKTRYSAKAAKEPRNPMLFK
jgi:hypothetical protein